MSLRAESQPNRKEERLDSNLNIMERNELFLKTAFCCMACDGDIANEEVELLKRITTNEHVFDGIDVQGKINEYVEAINSQGERFLNDYVVDVKEANLDDESSLQLIKIAIDTIEIDKEIKYSEVSFFKRIRKNLSITDEKILKEMPDKEDYLLPDIEDDSIFYNSFSFDTIAITANNG